MPEAELSKMFEPRYCHVCDMWHRDEDHDSTKKHKKMWKAQCVPPIVAIPEVAGMHQTSNPTGPDNAGMPQAYNPTGGALIQGPGTAQGTWMARPSPPSSPTTPRMGPPPRSPAPVLPTTPRGSPPRSPAYFWIPIEQIEGEIDKAAQRIKQANEDGCNTEHQALEGHLNTEQHQAISTRRSSASSRPTIPIEEEQPCKRVKKGPP